MKPSVQRLLDRYYPVQPNGSRPLDTDHLFYEWISSELDGQSRVLNVGAGPTPLQPRRRLRGQFARLVGVDPDPIVLTNTDLDEAHVNDGVSLPFPDGAFDAAYSDWTTEHVAEPLPFLREIHRVLRPGGSYWFRTNNRYHYAVVISALTTHRFHRRVFRMNEPLKGQHDPWPTRYRMNTARKARRLLRAAGFETPEILTVESNPGAYLGFSKPLFLLGVGYERLVNGHPLFRNLRFTLLVRARKGH